MDEDQIRARLKNHILLRVADATGLHYATVRRFMKGQGPFCGTTLKQEGGPYQQSTLNLLRRYLEQ